MLNFSLPRLAPWLLLLFTCLPLHAFALVTASVDRTQVSLEETLTLTISVTDSKVDGKPDSTVLQNSFEILSQQQSNQTTYINGAFTNSKKWVYVLAPKRAGTLTIPPISLGREKTRSIKINVAKPAPRPAGQEDIFVESSISADEVWVQSELEFVFKLFTAVTFREASLEDIKLDDAIVQPGKESQYNTRVNGRYYQVIERRYSIFPQSSGTLEIPSILFQASVDDYGNRRSLLAPGRLVRKRSQPYSVTVKAAPAEFAGKRWLPARDMKIAETWSDDPEALRTGQSITRTLTIEAEGLLAAQLPPQSAPDVDGLKIYPDRGETEDRDGDGGQTGIRIESQAMIPTRAGDITLPPIEIVWFNTKTGRTETASLPARSLKVIAAAGTSANPASGSAVTATPVTQTATGSPVASTTGNMAWIVLSAVLALLLCASNLLWWRRSRNNSADTRAEETADKAEAKQLRKDLFKAISRGDLRAVRSNLLHWARAHYSDESILTLRDVGGLLPGIDDELLKLEAALYSDDPGRVGSVDLAAIKHCVQKPPAADSGAKKAFGLQPLYRA